MEHDEQATNPEHPASDDDGLLSRLRVIEDQPLAERATAYGQVHDGLRSRLESGDAQRRDG